MNIYICTYSLFILTVRRIYRLNESTLLKVLLSEHKLPLLDGYHAFTLTFDFKLVTKTC